MAGSFRSIWFECPLAHQYLQSSIRVPAHFCGLYGFKPSSNRLPTYGVLNSLDGQESVPSAFGPLSTSLSGITTLVRGILSQEPWNYCPNTVPKPWTTNDYTLESRGGGKDLCFGLMWDEGSVKPLPPVHRALEMTKKALEAAGHSGMYHVYHATSPQFLRDLSIIVVEWKSLRHSEYVALAVSHCSLNASQCLASYLTITPAILLPCRRERGLQLMSDNWGAYHQFHGPRGRPQPRPRISHPP